ncbi:MAG: pyridoxal phosphate-dependent aminotransferase [Opitutaceae bacterium]|jgi:aspartate aminotransferase|nr:pyridoxal phosphate-dependent aminotransferase [Opitutaceae bacterium]
MNAATSRGPLSTWALNAAPSPTLAVDTKAKALTAAGEDVCGFAAGEPDFDTPEHIKEAAIAALRDGKTKYAPTPGILPLREAVAADCAERLGVAAVPAQVIVSPGGKFSCYLALLATCSPGDEVLIPAPYWVSYPEMAKLAGAKPVFIPTTEASGFRVTPEQLEAAVTPRTRLLILNSPSNPTGAVYSRKELEGIADVALRRGLLILSDEIYEHLIYDGERHVSPASFSAEMAARVIITSGFSKTYAMTGWRLGTTVAPLPIAKAIAGLQSQTASNATTFAQYGALAALREKEKSAASVAAMLAAFDRRRRFLHAELNKIPGVRCALARGAFYLFPNISAHGLSSERFCELLLERQKVAAVFGSAFGAEGHLRLSYATGDATLQKGVARLAEFCASLQ